MLMLLQNSEFVMEEETSKAEAPGARERPRAARSPVAAARLCLARVVSLAVNRVCPLSAESDLGESHGGAWWAAVYGVAQSRTRQVT